jgi:hypothetical protein
MKPTPPSQVSFDQAEYNQKKKRTRREIFLERMAPWARLMEVIERVWSRNLMVRCSR